jgi:ATP-dependent metalloprotease
MLANQERVVVIASTNFPDALDKAVTRPGRFDRMIHIPEPTYDGRFKLFTYYLHKLRIPSSGVDITKLAMVTGGFTGADIKNMVNIAATQVLNHKKNKIEQADMNEAFERIQMGLKRSKSISTEEDLLRTAYHESGHAAVGLLTEGAMKLNKITILPVGPALG